MESGSSVDVNATGVDVVGCSSDTVDSVVDNRDDQSKFERRLNDSNAVSCEDLLEISDKKPNGRERGVESDEVRIMAKVLGTVVSS